MIEIIFESFGDLFKGFDAFLKTRDLTIGAILAWIAPFILIWIKISKEKEKRSRSILVERRQLQIAFNVNEIMEKLGVESKWSIQEIGSTHTVQKNSKPWLTIFTKVMQKMKSLYPRRKKTMNSQNINYATLIPAVLGAIKLILQPFGVDLSHITDSQVNDVVNGVAALVTIVGIFLPHTKGETQNVDTKPSIELGANK